MVRDPDVWRWRHVLPMALLPLLMGSVDTSRDFAPMGPSSGARLVSCNFDVAIVPHCNGAIAGPVPTADELRAFVSPPGHMRPSHETDRRTRCVSPPDALPVCIAGQHAQAHVLDDIRTVDLTQLKKGQAIVVGSFDVKHRARPDWYYNVGDNFPNDPEVRRIFVVATYHAPQGAADIRPGYGHAIAEWRFYGLRGKTAVDLERHGLVWYCDHAHHPSEPFSADFLNCSVQGALDAYADKYQLSFPNTLALYRCVSSAVLADRQRNRCAAPFDSLAAKSARVANRAAGDAQLQGAVAAMHALVAEFGFSDDPYWFSCAGGCCTAEGRQ